MTTMREAMNYLVVRHEREVADGKHDEECEFGPRTIRGRAVHMYMCHCSKRRRERDGYTEPPGPLIPPEPPAPICPRCHREVEHDGDVWVCRKCVCTWPDLRSPAHFTDDYGDAFKASE